MTTPFTPCKGSEDLEIFRVSFESSKDKPSPPEALISKRDIFLAKLQMPWGVTQLNILDEHGITLLAQPITANEF